MPRRYGADGTRLWNGKTPEEFTEADAYRFMAETEAVLQRKELMDDPAQPAPASGKEEFYLSKKDDVLLTPEQIAAEERRWLFDAPIAELAEVKGVSIDEAVKMRTDAVLQEAVVPITVSVRPIEPQGKLIGFASVNFGGVVIDDFKVVDGKNGIFLGAPSKPDPASRTGYRATVRIPDRATQERINAAGVEAYHAAVEQLVARAQAVRPAPIKEQMAEAAKQDEIELVLTAGYQDAAARQSAYEAAVQSYRESGCSEEEATAKAATVQPAPEASEYATGYGADILAADSMEKDTGFADTRAYEWLEAYAAEYGFILRWPQERQAATGMVFEPWHWRYVGVENALAIRASGLSLEEFLALQKAS